jgi:hypothetical protein
LPIADTGTSTPPICGDEVCDIVSVAVITVAAEVEAVAVVSVLVTAAAEVAVVEAVGAETAVVSKDAAVDVVADIAGAVVSVGNGGALHPALISNVVISTHMRNRFIVYVILQQIIGDIISYRGLQPQVASSHPSEKKKEESRGGKYPPPHMVIALLCFLFSSAGYQYPDARKTEP